MASRFVIETPGVATLPQLPDPVFDISASAVVRPASEASESSEDESSRIRSTSDGQSDTDNQPTKTDEVDHEKHPFFEPWEDSDLILVVGDEKFHVHRQILSIHSPVFKAMLNSQFKEATAKEIPLPGKKANEVLDFLKILYLKETEGINLNKMSHLLKLADEYHAKGVLDLCVKCLQDVAKSDENAVKVLFLATDTVMAREDDRLDSVRRECEILMKDMHLASITGKSDFKNLNRDSLENVFVKRTGRLEKFIKDVYPQLVGLVEYCLYLKLQSSPSSTRCPQHFPKSPKTSREQLSHKTNTNLLERIRSCSVCREMIKELVSSSSQMTSESNKFVHKYFYGGNCHFDQKLISLLQDLNNVISLPIFEEFQSPRPAGFTFSHPSSGFTSRSQGFCALGNQ